MASSEEYKKTVFIYKYIHLNSKQVILLSYNLRNYNAILTKKISRILSGKKVRVDKRI